VVALFLGWAIHNDVAYDNTAIWLHVAAHVRGRDDRLGRAVPALGLGIPAVTATAMLCAAIYGDWDILPSMLGAGFAVLLAGIGLSSVMSALFPYPAVRPGDSPFTQPQSGNTAAALIQALSFFATILLAAPALLLGAASIFLGGWYNWASLLVGLGFGVVCLLGGLHIGGRVFERRAPELLAFTARN
jgi:ABC-2 type transport system permease protein